jgi:hypothetical protein
MGNYPTIKLKLTIIVARILSLFTKEKNDSQISIFSIEKKK